MLSHVALQLLVLPGAVWGVTVSWVVCALLSLHQGVVASDGVSQLLQIRPYFVSISASPQVVTAHAVMQTMCAFFNPQQCNVLADGKGECLNALRKDM